MTAGEKLSERETWTSLVTRKVHPLMLLWGLELLFIWKQNRHVALDICRVFAQKMDLIPEAGMDREPKIVRIAMLEKQRYEKIIGS